MDSKQQPLHYQLVTGEIFFRHKQSEETLTTRVNGIIADESRQIPVRLLAKAQEALQITFFKNMGDEAPDCNVINVVIYSICHLGEFLSEEFHKEPEGTKLQEVAPAEQASEKKLSVMPKPISLEEAVEEAQKH